MCGIVGILNRDGESVDRAVLARMAETIHHRGPDGDGVLLDGPVGLYHKRLAIIDLTTGQQPMTAFGATIVFNGEIYNYLELKDELKARGYAFRTTSDTEVMLALYAEHGPDFVTRLNGMFAFLLYDAARRIVVAARDRFGIKPLYVHTTARHVLWASEIKALLEHPAIRREVDAEAFRDYVTYQFVLGQRTLFAGVHKILPGHYTVVDVPSGNSRVAKYWQLAYAIDGYHTERYFQDELRSLLESAVSLQMRSDVPVGTYLSGGMDSSIVTMLAAQVATTPLRTFTGAFAEGPDFDETPYASAVTSAAGAEGYVVCPTEAEFIDALPRLVRFMDEPAAGPGVFPQYIVSRLARQHVKVVLGGQGGDEVFLGYTRYVVAYLEQALKGAIFETNEEGDHIVSLRSILPNLPFLRGYVPMLRQFWETEAFEPMDRRYFRLVDRSGGALRLLSGDVRAAYDPDAVFSRFQSVFNDPETRSYCNKMANFDLVASLPALLQVEDRVSMAVSLESRVPLLDHRLVELVMRMPPRMKFRGAEMKYILKQAVQGLVPGKILDRKDKMGFPVPLFTWKRAQDFFRDVLLSRACRERGVFNHTALAAILDGNEPFDRRLWGVVNLELWHQQMIDRAA